MPVIGTFTAAKDGYAGNIRTLMLNGRVKILSYLYRSINALISEDLVSELGLPPGNLGFLTAT